MKKFATRSLIALLATAAIAAAGIEVLGIEVLQVETLPGVGSVVFARVSQAPLGSTAEAVITMPEDEIVVCVAPVEPLTGNFTVIFPEGTPPNTATIRVRAPNGQVLCSTDGYSDIIELE